MSRVRFGIDQLLAAPGLAVRRVGLVTNDAARLAQNAALPSRVALQQAGFPLVRLFAPEHGMSARAADGAAMQDGFDPLTGLPVISLYGERMKPSRASLADLDAVLFDIPDIGARFYTYIWTLWHVLEACAEFRVPLLVLDRPNPLGGELAAAEGPLLDTEKFSSFLGRAKIPIRHSLTVGELAGLWNKEEQLGADLQVIRCTGWRRDQHWPETNLPFIPTSPAIPGYESALLYPGLCMFEATNLSVGRGTAFPFQLVGAPWVNALQLVGELSSLGLPGVVPEPVDFVPEQNPHAGLRCQGVRLRVNKAKSVRPVSAGLQLLATLIRLHRAEFRWANYPTAANPGGVNHFERLIGQAGIREALAEAPGELAQSVDSWVTPHNWCERTRSFLLYD
ncbi:MAG: DUF1343 domain-containing protein [Verrucomicrobia bacterium]|nr:DUF1343 domain-containing protein [Verrucomicrobiota bacterium]